MGEMFLMACNVRQSKFSNTLATMFKSHGERQMAICQKFSIKYLKCQHLSKLSLQNFAQCSISLNMMSKIFKDKNMQIQCDVHMPNKVL